MSHSTVFKAVLLSLAITMPALSMAANLMIIVFSGGEVQQQFSARVGQHDLVTDQYGIASIDLEPGDYEVRSGFFGMDEAIASFTLDSSLQTRLFVDLSGGTYQSYLDVPAVDHDLRAMQAGDVSLAGPTGDLGLLISEQESGQPIADVRVFVRGIASEGQSDAEGRVKLSLPVGEHDLTLVHPRFMMLVKRDVVIERDTNSEISLQMQPSNITLAEHVVSAPFVEGSLASSIAAMKEKDVLGEAISSEQFSKSGDSSAAAALKRVTAITIVDGKFVFVRGLGERYSTILLNGLHIPSPEPTKRVVPLDIFPTDVIQSMDIQKTWSSDLPGTFAGGTVLINTRDIPKEDNFIQGSLSVGMNDATGDKQLFNADNDKAVPGLLLNLSKNFGVLTEEVAIGGTVLAEGITADEKLRLNQAMVNYRNYGLTQRSTGPAWGFSGTLGQGFKTSGGLKYGIAANLYYDRDDDADKLIQEEFQFEADSDQVVHVESSEQSVTQLMDKYGGLLSIALDDERHHKVKYTLVLLNENESLTNFAGVQQRVEGRFRERTFLQDIERTLQAHQFNGSHLVDWQPFAVISDSPELSWGVGLSTATRLEPGSFEYEYKEAGGDFVIDTKKLFYLYSDLEDTADNVRIDLKVPLSIWGRDHETRVGYFLLEKGRRLDNRRFKVEYADTLDNRPIDEAMSLESVADGGLDILDSYKPDDFYTATQSESSFYINQMLRPLERVQLSVGARSESSTQELRVGLEKTRSSLDTSDVLPFLSLMYQVTRDAQIRFGYSESISRPDFREFSPNRFKDPITEEIIFGFDGLQPTQISNYDLKFEIFPSFDEFWSVGVFAKEFTNPIETVRTISDVDVEISFRNATSASSVGVEVGFRKSLRMLSARLDNWFASGNYAYIDSEIELDKDNPANVNDQFIPFLTSDKRPMQGQSPYVANVSLGYDNFHTRRSATLLYNVFGRRISTLGINGNPDIYEEPFHRLDFVAKWGINDTYDEQRKRIGYTLGVKATNLLGRTRQETQASRKVLEYDPGRSFSLSFTMKY